MTLAVFEPQDQHSITVSVLRLPDDAARWSLVHNFLMLRKTVFFDKLRWNLFTYGNIEFEQYDTPNAVYLIAHKGDEVVGGARLLPTTHRVGTGITTYSYMIRDAWRQILPGLPSDLCDEEPPVDRTIWELTRLTTVSAHGPGVAKAILSAANLFLSQIFVRKCLFLGSPAFMRIARNMGYHPIPLGQVTGNQDGRFIAFSCDVVITEAATS